MTRRLVVALVALMSLLAIISVPTGTLAQGTNTVHLVIGGGPEAGTYDLTTEAPCSEGDNGPGTWAIFIEDTGAMPSDVSLMFATDPSWNMIRATFGDPAAGGPLYRTDFVDQGRATIDGRGDAVTLSLAVDLVHVYDAALGRDIDVPASVVVECRVMERRNPVPSYGGALTPAPLAADDRWNGPLRR